MNIKWFALLGTILFLGVAVAPSVNATQSTEQDKVLTKQHVPYLLFGLITIRDAEIKLIVKDVINEILQGNGATSEEVHTLVKSSGSKWNTTYTFARVVTTENTDCKLQFFPGLLRHLYDWEFRAKGMVISYYPYHDLVQYGWHLTINNEKVSKESGIIIGYFGQWSFWMDGPPSWQYSMFLDGVALLVLHGK